MFSIDSSEVNELTIDLTTAPRRVVDNLDDVFANEARALQGDMKRDATGHRYLPKLAKTMTAKKVETMHHVIGFNTGGQGSLGHILVDPGGGARNAPIYDFWAPLRRRTPYFLEHLSRVAADSIFTTSGWR